MKKAIISCNKCLVIALQVDTTGCYMILTNSNIICIVNTNSSENPFEVIFIFKTKVVWMR